eukprot:3904665-Prymnesium_polylepis.2
MAVSVDHSSTMNDLRDFIKEKKLKISTSGPGRTKDKILAEIKAMMTNEVTDKSSIQDIRAYIQIKKLDIKTAGKGRTKAAILQDIRNVVAAWGINTSLIFKKETAGPISPRALRP